MTGTLFDAGFVIAAAATSLSVACEWPQIRKLHRTGDVTGVSLWSASLGVVSESGWIVYLGGAGLWPAVPESVLSVVAAGALAAALVRADAAWAMPLAAGLGWSAVLVTARVVGGLGAIGIVLSIAFAVQLAPAVWAAWRTWRPSGIAATTWVMWLVQSMLWGAYGGLHRDLPLVALGVVGTVASIAVLARLVVARGRSTGAERHLIERPDDTNRLLEDHIAVTGISLPLVCVVALGGEAVVTERTDREAARR